jgi:steroid 5-alpha reductase family enzyme
VTLPLAAWATAAALQLVLWLVAQRTKNAAIVDVGWAASFTLVVAVFAWRAPIIPWPIAIVVVAWSLRLTLYLVARGAATGPEEGRYVELRRKWSPHSGRRFFLFFQAQALLTGILSLAFVVPFLESPAYPAFVWVGVATSALGIAGEAIADWQLAAFKRRGTGGVCDVGLWSWSRHPNYFFEWCVWIGYAGYGLAFAPWGLVALVPQAIIVGSILGVTGIPPTEEQAIRKRGDAYRAYQARVSKFIPWPPKRS